MTVLTEAMPWHHAQPSFAPLQAGRTLVDLFFDRVDRWPDRTALRRREGGVWKTISWHEYGAAVREAAAGLVALGVEGGNRVGLLAGNQPRWHMADMAVIAAGAVTVPAYPTGTASQVAHVLGHSGSRACFVGDRDQLAKLLLARPSLPALDRIVMLGEPPDGLDDDLLLSFDDLRSLGRQQLERDPETVEKRTRSLSPKDVATIVYTSGTTGLPRGTMLTHENMSETIRSVTSVVSLSPADRFFSFLPLSHIAERVVSHLGQIASGGETWFADSLATVPEDLRACRPTIFFAVPRVWEKFQQAVLAELARLPRPLRAAADRWLELGRARVAAAEGLFDPPELRDRVAHAALDATVGRRLRRRLGLDKGRVYVSSAAPIDPELLWWFHAAGITISEVYGQTEDCGPTTMNRPGRIRIGTVGEPLPRVEVRLGLDGEVLVRGPNVCAGYWRDPAATAELLEDGWMHSGDLGRMEDGYLSIVGRKKDLIVTSSGKNIAPQDLETRLRAEPLVSQAVVVGDGRKYLTALLALDDEAVSDLLEEAPRGRGAGHAHGPTEVLAGHPLVHERLQRTIDELNAGRAPAERIRDWRILPRDLTVAGGELTPTMKVRRGAVIERFGDLVEEMYAR